MHKRGPMQNRGSFAKNKQHHPSQEPNQTSWLRNGAARRSESGTGAGHCIKVRAPHVVVVLVVDGTKSSSPNDEVGSVYSPVAIEVIWRAGAGDGYHTRGVELRRIPGE